MTDVEDTADGAPAPETAAAGPPRQSRVERRRAERAAATRLSAKELLPGVGRLNLALFASAVLLACVLGALLVARPTGSRSDLLDGVREAVAAVSSYDYADLDASMKKALPYTADPYRTNYRTRMESFKEQNLPTSRYVEGTAGKIAVESVTDRGRVAVVLVYGKQEIHDRLASGEPTLEPISVKVTLVKVDGTWRISDMQLDSGATA